VTGEPYLVLEVASADLVALSAGFEIVLDGLVPRLNNPYARIELDAGSVTLLLRGQSYGPVAPLAPWPTRGPCQIFLVPAGVLPAAGADREVTLVDLINGGDVLMAVNRIRPA